MSNRFKMIVMSGTLVTVTLSGEAAVIDGVNWADKVHSHSSAIQNYSGALLSADTEFWLTGSPDADANGNGYAWDPVDPDYVAGWRSNAPDEFIVMKWDVGIPDRPGNDLTILLYSGLSASANVVASTDGLLFTAIGTVGGGTPGYLFDVSFDFVGSFADDVHFVKIERIADGPNTAMFFDSFGGVVPEPATLALLACGAAITIRRKRRT